MAKWGLGGLVVPVLCLAGATPGQGYDLTEKFSVGGILSFAYQYQWAKGDDNKGRGALPFQPELSFRPTERDEIFAKFGFAAGEGLKAATNFDLAPWAGDLEDDVRDINGSNRDYLLNAWYRHIFEFPNDHTLTLTGGVIDATDYVDDNLYANDEYTQFMNAALVNGPNGFAPSYDVGGAVEWEFGSWGITGVFMNVAANQFGNSYNFFAAQIGHRVNTPLGKGTYRLVGQITDAEFPNARGDAKEPLMGGFLSFDQELGDTFGAWIRFGWQDDRARIDYDALFSGGLNITGTWYGRDEDNIGIGYAYLNGRNNCDAKNVVEAYWRFVLHEYIAVTADLQYMDDRRANEADDVRGLIGGVRLTTEF